mgnify:CR=1 FL=1
MAKKYERAHAALSADLKLAADHLDLLIDRSLVYATSMNYWETVDDLNLAIYIDPNKPRCADVPRQRLSLSRQPRFAADDVNSALSFKPDHVAAIL